MIFQKLSVYGDNTLVSNKGNMGAILNTSNILIQTRFNSRVIPPTPRNI